jgi:hypothetical protein
VGSAVGAFWEVKGKAGGYFTTDGRSVSMSWYQAPLWDLRPGVTSCLKFAVLFLCGALSDERTGLQFAMSSRVAQKVVLVLN